jgi:hypothetical protein
MGWPPAWTARACGNAEAEAELRRALDPHGRIESLRWDDDDSRSRTNPTVEPHRRSPLYTLSHPLPRRIAPPGSWRVCFASHEAAEAAQSATLEGADAVFCAYNGRPCARDGSHRTHASCPNARQASHTGTLAGTLGSQRQLAAPHPHSPLHHSAAVSLAPPTPMATQPSRLLPGARLPAAWPSCLTPFRRIPQVWRERLDKL